MIDYINLIILYLLCLKVIIKIIMNIKSYHQKNTLLVDHNLPEINYNLIIIRNRDDLRQN